MMWVTRRVVLLLVVVAQVATRQGLVGMELSPPLAPSKSSRQPIHFNRGLHMRHYPALIT